MDRNWQNINDRETISAVALRKESVDRNVYQLLAIGKYAQSLSARRAWIEILLVLVFGMPTSVALRKESVDRNTGP